MKHLKKCIKNPNYDFENNTAEKIVKSKPDFKLFGRALFSKSKLENYFLFFIYNEWEPYTRKTPM